MNEIEQLAGQVREAQLEIRSLKSKLLGVMEGNGISASAIVGSVAGSGYQTVQDEGTPLTQRTAINFVGAGVVAADSGGVTTVTIAGGGGSTVATDPIWDALGDTVYGTGADTGAKLAGNITTTRKFLRQVGNGAVSAAPAWDTLVAGDIPSLAASYVAVGAAAGGDLGGTYPNPTVNATHSGSAHHAAVTLNAAADTVLGLSTQQLTLDTQTANTVWAGPTSGGAATPTFRALVAADMPSGIVDLSAIDFLVGTATGLLSAEIVVGTTPGGELGGTWASPTVDATHSGSAHHTQGHVFLNSTNHTDTLTGTVADGDTLIGNATPAWSRLAISIPVAGGVNVFAVYNGETRPSWKPLIGSVAPSDIALTASAGTAAVVVVSRRDHVHATPLTTKGDLLSVSTVLARLAVGADGLFLKADSTQTTGLVWAAGGAGSVATDPIWDAAGDLAVGTGADAAARYALSVPAANVLNVLAVANGETTFTWKALFDATNPAAIGTAAPGTSLIAAHRDHVHAAVLTAITGGNWKLPYTNGSGAVIELSLGAASTVLQGNGATSAPTFTGSPQLTAIKDTGGAERIFFDPTGGTYSTIITLTGSTATTSLTVGPTASTDALIAGILGTFSDLTTGAGQPPSQIALWASIGSAPTLTTNGLIGIAGKATMHTQTTSTAVIGLDFLVGFTAQGATVKTLANFLGIRISKSGANATGLTITNDFSIDIGALAYASLVAVTNSRGLYVRGGSSAKVATHRGVMIDSYTATTVANNPFYDTGLASTRDADGNRFRSNTQFGSVTGAFGTGDGVVGLANATTNPSTNPAVGGVLYSNAGALTWRGSGGTVTAIAPAGPHCGVCGLDFWSVKQLNVNWQAWLFVCGSCGKRYEGGPTNVLSFLDAQQKEESFKDNMEWDDVMQVMGIAA